MELDAPNTGAEQWYFAYGSNLSTRHNQWRRKLIQRIEPAWVREFQLAFNHAARSGDVFANIVWHPWATIWGAAYLCNVEAMARLDRAEGAIGHSYRPRLLQVETKGGETLLAKAYVSGKRFVTKPQKPGEAYLQLMLQGAREHNLPEEYLKQIKTISEDGKNSADGRSIQKKCIESKPEVTETMIIRIPFIFEASFSRDPKGSAEWDWKRAPLRVAAKQNARKFIGIRISLLSSREAAFSIGK